MAEQDEFFLMELWLESDGQFHAHDLVLFATEYVNVQRPGEQYVPHALGVVDSSQRAVKVYVMRLKSQNERVVALQEGIKRNMREEVRLPFYVHKLCQMSTIEREFRAVQGLAHMQLRSHILHPRKYAKLGHDYFEIPSKLKAELDNTYNESQIAAIRETLKTQGITLVQGPPGKSTPEIVTRHGQDQDGARDGERAAVVVPEGVHDTGA